jgi:hypothetical protein
MGGSLVLARRQARRLVPLVVLGVGMTLALVAAPAFAATATLKEEHKGATNPGFEAGECPTNPNGTGDWGWHFVLQGNETTFNSVSAQFENAGTITDFVSTPTGKHAYVFTPGPDTLIDASADVTGPDPEFNLSHVCTGTTNGGGGNGGGIEVGGITAERPGGAAAATAATAVTAEARFTG